MYPNLQCRICVTVVIFKLIITLGGALYYELTERTNVTRWLFKQTEQLQKKLLDDFFMYTNVRIEG